jgi:predicted TIM-barrel fold metal-dependent hydrolase
VRFLDARRRGIGKVMWGTDHPLILHEESLGQIDEMELKPEARRALLHDTAVKVFKLDDPLLEPVAVGQQEVGE